MSVKIIQERLESYGCTSTQEEEQALREITQEIALAALSRSDFFKRASFQGGTALRILYSLQRFSEDLDFTLLKPDASFKLASYLKNMSAEFEAYGFKIAVEDPAFLKENSIGKILMLRYPLLTGTAKQIVVKFEVDTNPPLGSRFETKYPDFPAPFPVTVQDFPSLFSGKCHALLCREYLKGRDWYDFVWYASRKPKLNFEFFSNACHQQGNWKGKNIQVTQDWFVAEMGAKIRSIDWKEAKKDVERFVKVRDRHSLELWSREFMLDRLSKVMESL